MATTTGRATDFITFSRASLGTVTGSDGKVKWAGHNLLLASEQFDNAAWTKPGIDANVVVAPNGTTTADKLKAVNTSNGTHQCFQINLSLTVGASYTMGCFLKKGEYSWGMINAYDNVGLGKVCYFNLDTGVLGTVASGCTASISSVGNGWYLCTVTYVAAGATGGLSVEFSNADNTQSFAGAVGSGIYLWGAHLYRSDLGGMVLNPARGDAYYPTTPKNLLGYTTFASGWSVNNSAVITPNDTVGPDGLNTGAKIALSAHAFSNVYQSVSSYGTHTISVWMRGSAGGEKVVLASYNDTNFLQTSSVITLTTTWTRYSWTNTVSANSAWYISNGDATARTIYAWGAQVSNSASLDAYSANAFAAPTAAAYHAPRLDYGADGVAKGLLVEEQRTNLLTYSAQFAFWTKTEVTVTSGATTSPSGTLTADSILETAVNDIHRIYLSGASVASGTSYTWSGYVKANGRSILQIVCGATSVVYTAEFDLNAVTTTNRSGTGTATITSVGGGWYRITATAAATASGSGFFQLSLCSAANTTTYLGDVTKGIYLWGAQLEAGSFATSYIPTTSASVTRSADIASVATSAFPYSSTAGTVVVNASFIGVSDNVYLATLNDGTSSNMIASRRFNNNKVAAFMYASGVDQWDQYPSVTVLNVGDQFKHGLAFAVNDGAQSLNGQSVATDQSMTLPAVSILNIGSRNGGAAVWNGHIRQITYIPRRLTNAELQARTA